MTAALLAPALFLTVKAWRVGLFDGLPGFRAAAVEEYPQGENAPPCRDCHADVGSLHSRGPHARLLCEDCHGFQARHRADGETPPEGITTGSIVRLCSRCHRDRSTGGADPPRINLEAHVIEVGALFSESVCFDCHRPHDPRP